MANTPLMKKLRMEPGQQILILNAPEGYLDLLGQLPEGSEVSSVPGGKFDFVHIFAADSAELDELKLTAADSVEYDALLWVSYPKKSSKVESDLNRDVMWDLFTSAGLRPYPSTPSGPPSGSVRMK